MEEKILGSVGSSCGLRMQSSSAIISAGQPLLRNVMRSQRGTSNPFPIPCCRFWRRCTQSSSRRMPLYRSRRLVRAHDADSWVLRAWKALQDWRLEHEALLSGS
jgi:hypothetical protein